MKKIGIKLADGTFFPILEDGSPEKKEVNLTTVKDNQTKVKVDLYRGEKSSIDEAEYLDTLEISKMKKHPNGEPNIGLAISLDEKNELSAKIVDKESGAQSQVSISLLSEIKNGKKSDDAENSDEAEGVTLASSPAQESVSEEAENAPIKEAALDFDLPDLNVPAEETVQDSALPDVDLSAQEIPAKENDGAPAETTQDNFADDLPSLDEMDLSLPEISEQDGGAPAEAALQNDDFSLDETVSAEPPNDEPSPIDENVSEEAVPDLDVPAEENEIAPTEEAAPDVDFLTEEIPAEETESAPTETTEENLADDLPSLDEMDLSLPEVSEPSSDEPQPSPIDENLSEEAAPDLDFPTEEIPAKENDGAPVEAAQDNLADDLPSLDEMDLSLPEISEQDGGAPTEAALQDDDFSLDETVSAEPSNDEPQPSPIDENISEEVVPNVDVPVQEIPTEENESAPAETAQDNFADDLPSLDEMDFSLPEVSEQDGAGAEEAAPDFDLPDLDVPAEETVQDSALPNLDLPDISFDESDFSGTKNETQNESDSANDDLDFSDMDFELPNFDDMDFSSDGTNSNFDGEKKSSAHNSFNSFSEHNASSAGALDFSDLYDDENDYGEDSQEKNQRFPLLVCIVCAIICVLALLGILFVAPMRFNSFSKNQPQDSAQELPSDSSSEQISSELPPPPEQPAEPIAPPAKEDEIVVITETKNVVPDFPPPQEKKSEPKEIIYKIKWGDTLWDLSAAYYKNPWLYPKIARYNNIKNPDYIIAGSTIRIPEE